jgi:hypothetical protein
MSEQARKSKLHFEFSSEGIFSFKSSVFKLSMPDIPLLPSVGVARELLFPIYEIIKESFVFFDKQDKEVFLISSYKPKKTASNGQGVMLSINGSFKSIPTKSSKEYPAVNFEKKLFLKFNKYENAEIYHDAKWEDSLDVVFGGADISVDDLLMGVGVFVSDFNFGIEEYAKYGIGYKWFNVPSKRASFEISIGSKLELTYRIAKGTSEEFLIFLTQILDIIADIFALDESALSKFQEVKSLTMEIS